MSAVETTVPKNISIEDSKGVLGTTTITYNEVGVTYNQVGQIYGGADILDSTVPSMIGIFTPISNTQAVFTQIPNNVFLENSQGIFGSSILTYNESGITYNEAGEIYAGGDVLAGAIPNMLSVGKIEVAVPVPGATSGQPYGLLLVLTQP